MSRLLSLFGNPNIFKNKLIRGLRVQDTGKNRPRVSVIIPTFNRRAFLLEAVNSVYRQSCADWELIAVDDGSTDGTEDVFCGLPEVRYRKLEQNHGVSYARNRGLEMARGEWICFLDSDDLWEPDKLKRQLEWMDRNPDCRACYTDEIWIRNGVRVNPMKKHRKYSGWIFRHCIPLCIISPSSIMMDRRVLEHIGPFDESLPACEDYDLWLRLSLKYPVHFLEEKLIVKRGGHADQLSRKFWGMDRFRVQALEKILQEEDLMPEQRGWVMEMLIEKCRILELGFHNNGKQEEARFFSRKKTLFEEQNAGRQHHPA